MLSWPFKKKKIRFLRSLPLARMPVYATEGAAAFDFFAAETGTVHSGNPLIINTGIRIEIPKGYCLKIYSRSGHGFNKDIRLANCVGIIDSDYRGDIKVKLTPDSPKAHLSVMAGDRIAQGVIERCELWEFEEVLQLSETERGAGGFGSTDYVL